MIGDLDELRRLFQHFRANPIPHAGFDIGDFAAFAANQMVVMVRFVIHLKRDVAMAQINPAQNADALQSVGGSVNRGLVSNMFVETFEDFLDG